MATLNWADIVELSHDEAKQDLLDFLDAVGFTATSWQEGSIPLACLELTAEVWSRLSRVAVFLKSMGFNSTATGDALTRYSASAYKTTREPPVAARRRITLTCSATEGPHSIGLGDVVATAGTDPDGNTFRNIEGLSVTYPFVLASGASKQFMFEAEVAGQLSLLPPSVTSLVTTIAGVRITDDAPEREGVAEESDARLRLRNETQWALLTQYELIDDAVVNLTLKVDSTIETVAVDSSNPRGAGTFDVYIAQADQTGSTSQELAVKAALAKRIMGGIGVGAVQVYAAPAVLLDLTGTVYHSATHSMDAVQAGVEAALKAFVRSIPLGGFDYSPGPTARVPLNDIEAAIKSALVSGQAGAIKTVKLTTPVDDIVVTSWGKVVRGNWSLTYVPVNNG